MPSVRTDPDSLRKALADELRRARVIRSPEVEAAFRKVPHHVFVPQTAAADAYHDDAIVTHWGPDGLPTSSSSQPGIMAIMREIVGGTGGIVAIDIDPDVAEEARRPLETARCPGVAVVAADGGFGHPEGAPYDRMIRGRPGLDRLRIDVVPPGRGDRPGGWRLRRRWSDIVCWLEA